MTVDTRPFTADELLQLPEDGFRYELVRGELRKMSPAGTRHGKISLRIATRLAAYVEQHRLGQVYSADTGFRLFSNPDTVRAPDVSFVQAHRLVDTADSTITMRFPHAAPQSRAAPPARTASSSKAPE